MLACTIMRILNLAVGGLWALCSASCVLCIQLQCILPITVYTFCILHHCTA